MPADKPAQREIVVEPRAERLDWSTTAPRTPAGSPTRPSGTPGQLSAREERWPEIAGDSGDDEPERQVLLVALDDWLAATEARDIERQMRFYPEIVPVFYRARDVSREAVRAEKVRVFGDARIVDLRASEPTVILGAEGRTAVMRFRKAYVIRGPRIRREGEVLQELRWADSSDGWRIIGERDVRVLR